MSSALSWLDAKMSGPSGSGGRRATTTPGAGEPQDRAGPREPREPHREVAAPETSISGRLTTKKNTIETAV